MKSIYMLFFKKIRLFYLNTKGQKRLFIIAGTLNVLVTNIALQFFIILELFPIIIATLFSQIINMFFGYFLYSRKVFSIKKIYKLKFFIKYMFLMIILWQINTVGIVLLTKVGITKAIAAIILVPMLAIISFILQKIWIFLV